MFTNGSYRAQTAAKMEALIGRDVCSTYRLHDSVANFNHFASKPYFYEGQWALQLLSECLEHAKIIVVSEAKNQPEMEAMGLIFRKTVYEAVEETVRQSGSPHRRRWYCQRHHIPYWT